MLTQTKTKLAKKTLLLLFCLLLSLFSLIWSSPAFAVTFEQARETGKRLSAGYHHSLALKVDDTIVAWGDNTHGQCDIPEGLSDVKMISAGYFHNLALKADGTVVAWGKTGEGQCTIPEDLSGISAIAAGGYHSLALKDGQVIAWGLNGNKQCEVPLEAQNGVTAIAAGGYHSLALKDDGTVVAWGNDNSGQCAVPTDLTDVIALAAGDAHSLALKSDGTVEAWGANLSEQCDVPADLSNVIAISAGYDFSVALIKKANDINDIKIWGNFKDSFSSFDYDLKMGISAGSFHILAVTNYKIVTPMDGRNIYRSENRIEATGNNNADQCNIPTGLNIVGYLADLTVTVGEKEIILNPNDIEYHLDNVPNNVTSIKITATKESAKQTLNISNGIPRSYNLNVGFNEFIIKVSLQDEGLFREYKIIIYRDTSSVDLSMLSTDVGEDLRFEPRITTYKTNVNRDINNINITAVAIDPEATVIIGQNLPGVGEQTATIPLTYGENVVKITVKRNEQSKTYTLQIIKAGFLDNIFVSEGQPHTVFDSETFDHTINVNSSTSVFKITPVLKNSAHELFINGFPHESGIAKEFVLSEEKYQTIKLEVKIPDTSTVRTYTININRVTKDDFIGSGTIEDPYLIYNLHTLQEIAHNPALLDKHFQLACNLNATNTVNWNNGTGFIPIGNLENKFTGYFDGAGHTITGLYINRPEREYVGLFGCTENGEIRNLGLENCTITGKNKVGALFGNSNNTYFDNCFSTGTVIGTSKVGGLGGSSSGDYLTGYHLDNCYSRASVHGKIVTGGLIGELGSGWLNYCYAAGSVQGTGGLVGSLVTPANCQETDCYWDIEISGQTTSALGISKTTAEMQKQTTYNNWDFIGTWAITPETNEGYPYLRVFKDTSSSIIDDSLVLWLDAKHGSNDLRTSIWKDLSGKGIHGELKNFNFTENSGWSAEGLKFDGIDDYVEFGDYLDLRQHSRTYTLWFKLDNVNSNRNMYFLSKVDNGATSFRHGICVRPYGEGFIAIITDKNNTHYRLECSAPLVADKMYHLAWVIDRNGYSEIFLDGVSIAKKDISLINNQDFIKNRPFRIGCYTQYGNNAPYSFLGGVLNSVRVYNRALTADEVIQNYQAEIPRIKAMTAANLAELTITPGALSPVFKASNRNYTVILEDRTVNSVDITATPLATDATVTIDGQGGIGSQTQTITITSVTTIPIVVTEADGTTTKTYKVKIIKPGYLTNLSINGETVPGFTSETFDYTVNVANATNAVDIAAILEDPTTQDLMINNQPYTSGIPMNISLNVGANTIPVKVTVPGYSTTYTLNIYRATTADLQALTIEPEIEGFNFDPATITYTVTLDQVVDSINITATPFEDTATVMIGETSGTTATEILALGTNPIEIVVTSGDDSLTKTYTLNVIRPAYLTNLAVKDGEEILTLSPEFTSTTFDYTLPTVANSITSLDITAIREETANALINDVTPTDNIVNVPLNVGENTITIKTAPEAEPELITTYTITVNREPSANAYLESLTTTAGTWDSDFDSATTTYKVTLEGCIDTLDLTAKAAHPEATVKINDTVTQTVEIPLKLGTNTVIITVTAEDGTTTKEYTVDIIRPAYLTALSVKDGEEILAFTPEFATTIFDYTLPTVANSVTSLDITAIGEETAKVLINDVTPTDGTVNVSLEVGANIITIEVTPNTEETIISTYTLTVHRAADVSLSNLETNIGILSPTFEAKTKAYTVTLDTLADTIEVTTTPTDSNATVTIGGESIDETGIATIEITAGSNTIPINIIGRDNITTGAYTLTVIRPAALTALTIDKSTLNQTFTPDIQTYTATIADRVTSLDVTATVEEGAELYISGELHTSGTAKPIELEVGSNEITIETVIADTTRTYTLTVTRTASKVSLSNLKTNIGTLTPVFNANTYEYTVILDSLADTIEVTATLIDSEAKVTINGEDTDETGTIIVEITAGSNIIPINITGWDGETTEEYTLTVIRPAALTDLIIDNVTLDQTFELDTQTYTATVDDRVTSLDVTATMEAGAELYINDELHTSGTAKPIELEVGSNEITIKTIIADITRTYTLTVTRTASDVSLSELSTDIGTPAFDAETKTYTITLNTLTDEIEVTATPADFGATITINEDGTGEAGSQTVAVSIFAGSNTIPINITGWDGETTEKYTLTVNRPAALTALTIDNSTLEPGFESKIQTYSANVEYEISSLNVTTVVETGADLYINGKLHTSGIAQPIELEVGSNEIIIKVKIAGTTRTYTLTVHRAVDVRLGELTISSGTLDPAFEATTTFYKATVDKTIEQITVTALPVDSEATVTIEGVNTQTADKSLSYGVNTIEVLITGRDGVTTQTYTIEVTRLGGLTALIVDEAELHPDFDSEILEYTVNVPNSTTELDFTATLANETTQKLLINGEVQVSGTPQTISLAIGPNPITIDVVMVGLTRTYTLTVNRAMSGTMNTDLYQLITDEGEITPKFDSEITTYTISVDRDNLTITAVPFDVRATVIINGIGAQSVTVDLEPGDNLIPIIVRAADESTSKTYTLKVIRGLSSNANLETLAVNQGTLSPEFNHDTAAYKVETAEEINQIKITAITADPIATFTIDEQEAENDVPFTVNLDQGGNLIPIVVTASDEITQKAYIVSVNGKVSNADLGSLTMNVVSSIDPEKGQEVELGFTPSVTEYQFSVDNTVEKLTLSAFPADNKALMLLNENILPAGEAYAIDLKDGENIIQLMVVAQDASTKTYMFKVWHGTPLVIETTGLASGILNAPYSAFLTAQGGSTPYTWSAIGLPAGLSLNQATGEITGIPESEGLYEVTISVTDAQDNSVSQNFTLRLNLACGNGGYIITPVENLAYTIEYTAEGLPLLTIKEGYAGFRLFSVNIAPVQGHPGYETLVFTHLRKGKQIQGNAITADYDQLSHAQAGFNVQPGDMIKIYMIDDFLSASPTIL